MELDPIPDVEWWDARILVDAMYPEVLADGMGPSSSVAADGTRGLVRGKVTALVEHPVPIEPPAEPEPPPPRPLMLTAKVRLLHSSSLHPALRSSSPIRRPWSASSVDHAAISVLHPGAQCTGFELMTTILDVIAGRGGKTMQKPFALCVEECTNAYVLLMGHRSRRSCGSSGGRSGRRKNRSSSGRLVLHSHVSNSHPHACSVARTQQYSSWHIVGTHGL